MSKCAVCDNLFIENAWGEIRCNICDKNKCYVYDCENVTDSSLFCELHCRLDACVVVLSEIVSNN